MRDKFEWKDDYPENDGEYFYYGNTPDGTNVVAIVSIYLNPNDNKRWASLFIPPGWRGNMEIKNPTVHYGKLEKWPGKWSGPEHGLTIACA